MLTTTVPVGEYIPDFLHNERTLPVGSEISVANSSPLYRVEAPGVLVSGNRGPFDQYSYIYRVRLRSLPDGQTELRLPPLDLESVRWRIRDAALASAERSNVATGPVIGLLRKIGAEELPLYLGMTISNGIDIHRLPEKSVLYSGDPSKANNFTVFRVRNGSAYPILGQHVGRINGAPLVIHEAAGLDPAPTPAAGDPKAMAQLMIRAWSLGRAVKQAQGWCSVFEQTLEALDITDKTAEVAGESPRAVGDVVQRDDAVLLPEGTLLGWHFPNSGGWVLFRRVEGMTNRSGTTRIWGHNDPGRNNHDQMTVVKLPGQDMLWNVQGSELREMPHGVRYLVSGQEQVTPNLTGVNTWVTYRVVGWPGVR